MGNPAVYQSGIQKMRLFSFHSGVAFFRICLHKKCMWIFEHNFVADKAKMRRRAVARQVFFTQYAAKFAEKARVYACEDRFLQRKSLQTDRKSVIIEIRRRPFSSRSTDLQRRKNMAKRQKQLRRVDDIHKPKPFLRFRFRAVVLFFIVCILASLVYYMILANADPSNVITG